MNQAGDGTSFSRHKRPESVVVVVYTKAGETLLLERLQPVFWQSVTGSLEWPDEPPEDAAHREVYEETGMEGEVDPIIKVGHCLGTTHGKANTIFSIYYY